jgi:predicted dehydrogenase
MTRSVGIALVGAGAMGKAHSLAFRTVGGVFDLPIAPRLEVIADVNEQLAATAAGHWGYKRHTKDWRSVIADPCVDIVDITAPNRFHREIALAAIGAGKHVYCEKPLAATLKEAEEMFRAAEKAAVTTQLGFNFLKNPMIDLAKNIIQSGEIGEIRSFRGIHAEDYMADPTTPWSWRLDSQGGGVVEDLGSHIVCMARHLLGPISRVCGSLSTVIPSRPTARGSTESRDVQVDDVAHALVQFDRGCHGTLEASWVATGRKMQLEFEVVGSHGSIAFTQERFSELQLFKLEGSQSRNGFRTIVAGPLHPPYGNFCVATGHQLGFNDMKTIEARDLLLSVAGIEHRGPDFREGYEVQKVIAAIISSSHDKKWVEIGQMGDSAAR